MDLSHYRHPLDGIHVGDYVALEVTVDCVGEEAYTYEVSGTVRKHDGVKAVGRNGLGEGKIIEHRPRPLPTAFGSHIRYPESGVEYLKTSGDYWRGDNGSCARRTELLPGWVLVRDAGAAS